MKSVLSLTRALSEEQYFKEMFKKVGEEKNILFVSPQLSGKHLYKMILPFYCLRSKRIATAISSLKKFNPRNQLLDFEIDLNEEMILWADYIILPFTTQPLVNEVYFYIRYVNPTAKICFTVDFNFYKLPEEHPYYDIFSDSMVLDSVEDNIYYSDIALVENIEFQSFLAEKFAELHESKYKDNQNPLSIACTPPMIDTKIMLENVDYDVQGTTIINSLKESVIHTPEIEKLIDETTKAEDSVRENDFKIKGKKEKTVSGKKSPKVKIINSDLKDKKNNNGKNNSITKSGERTKVGKPTITKPSSKKPTVTKPTSTKPNNRATSKKKSV